MESLPPTRTARASNRGGYRDWTKRPGPAEGVDSSDAEPNDYIRAFGTARAVSALSRAIAGDVAEAIYGASATVEDLRQPLALIEESLDDEGDR